MAIAERSFGGFDRVASSADRTGNKPGVLARFLNSYIKSQEVKARRVVDAHLSVYSDEKLAEMGFDKPRIARIRAGATCASLWY